MTLELQISQELEQRLSQEAERLGLPIDQYALRLLGAEEEAQVQSPNGAALVGYWRREGLVGSRSDIRDSQTHARRLRAQAERRQH